MSHVMIIALPISRELGSEQSFLFQNYVYKNFAKVSYDELIALEILKSNEPITQLLKAQICEKFSSVLTFRKENLSIINFYLNQIANNTNIDIQIINVIELYEYIMNHNVYPLFTEGIKSVKLYHVFFRKIVELLEEENAQSEMLINCLLRFANFMYCTTDDAIKTLIKKYYEVNSSDSVDNFFKKWRLYFVYHCIETPDNHIENVLIHVKEVDSVCAYLQYFPEMKDFFDEISRQTETEKEQT